MALQEYAIDNDGRFPEGQNANEAYRKLFDRKFQDERIFFIPGSAWHEPLPEGQERPDNDVGQPPGYVQGLERGENHWAYQSGLNNGSKGNLPVVMDGFTEEIGIYSDDPKKRGGVWEGEAAIVVRVDGSGKMEKVDGDGRVMEKKDGNGVSIFSKDYGSDPAQLLNPL